MNLTDFDGLSSDVYGTLIGGEAGIAAVEQPEAFTAILLDFLKSTATQTAAQAAKQATTPAVPSPRPQRLVAAASRRQYVTYD